MSAVPDDDRHPPDGPVTSQVFLGDQPTAALHLRDDQVRDVALREARLGQGLRNGRVGPGGAASVAGLDFATRESGTPPQLVLEIGELPAPSGEIEHVGTTEVWDADGQGLSLARPSGIRAGDLLVLILHRTDDELPLYVDSRAMDREWVIVGGGSRSLKIKVRPQALVAAGGLAAALSTAAGLLLAISSAISHDLLKGMITPDISEKGELMASRIPLGTLGQANDIANAVAFLASDKATYITGETLHVNGGMAML